MWPKFLLLVLIDLSVQQILVMVNNEQASPAGVESSPKREQNLTVLRHSSFNVSVPTNESSSDQSIESRNGSSYEPKNTNANLNSNSNSNSDSNSSGIDERLSKSSSDIVSVGESSSVYSASTADPIAGNQPPEANSTTTEESSPTGRHFITCPHYLDKKDGRKEISDLMRYTFQAGISLCNTSSRVGCRHSDFLRQIVNCAHSEYYTIDDIKRELSENKDQHDVPRETEESPLLAYISFKVVNIDAVSVKDMDFKMDFYMGVSWDVEKRFFRKYMTRICVAKKVDLEKRKKLILYQEDLKLFWLPDLYFPNAKSISKDEKDHLKRPISREFLEVSFLKNQKGEPFMRFVFVTSGHSNLLCPMEFNDYPSDKQECLVKIRSFYYYQHELSLDWYTLVLGKLKLLEYAVSVAKGKDLEEDHFVVATGDQDKNFTRILIHLNFTRILTSKLAGVYVPSMMLITLNYFTYYFGMNSYSSRCGIGILVLLTLTILFSKVRSELPGSSNISGMEMWLICCFICDLTQLVEAAIVESIYTNHCIAYYLRKKAKRELETEYLGYSYSMLFDDTSDEDEEEHFEEHHDDSCCSTFHWLCMLLEDFLVHLILPSFSRKKPEYWSVFVDKIFRILIPVSFAIFCYYYWTFLLRD